MSKENYINICCPQEKLDKVFTNTSFIIVIYDDDRYCSFNPYGTPNKALYYRIYYIPCPKDITINDIYNSFSKSIMIKDAVLTYGKFHDIKLVIDNLKAEPAQVTINLSNLSCDNLRDTLKTNLCNEIKGELTQIFEHKNIVDKLFAMIPQKDIDEQTTKLLSCLAKSEPFNVNMKHSTSKMLIAWVPIFTQYMLNKFNSGIKRELNKKKFPYCSFIWFKETWYNNPGSLHTLFTQEQLDSLKKYMEHNKSQGDARKGEEVTFLWKNIVSVNGEIRQVVKDMHEEKLAEYEWKKAFENFDKASDSE